MLPGQTDVAEQWPSQPELPAGGGDQAGPAVGGGWVAGADGGPAKGLFEEAEGVLDREAAQVPAPEDAQVGWEWTADPGQPEGARRQPLVGQAFDLDAHDAERRIRRAGHVEIRPGIDLHVAVDGVVQALCVLRLAVGVGLGQSKRRTMQARPTATSVLLRRAIHHAVFGQTHHQVGVDRAARKGFQIVATVECHHRTWRLCCLGAPDRRDLVQRNLGRRLRRWAAPPDIQRQHPTASHLRYRG
jgi:hypothetical protein